MTVLADPAPAREFFYLKDRRKQDAALHEPILAEGDTETAYAVSRKVAKRLGLTDAQIDKLMRPRPERKKQPETKDWDEAKHPRVPAGGHGGGQFSSGGDGGAPSGEALPPAEGLLIGTGTSRERVEGWHKQLLARQEELDKQGKLGSKEDIETQRMIGAFEGFLRTPQEQINSGEKVFHEVHDLDGNPLAAVFSQFNPKTRVAIMEFVGGLDHLAKVKALQHAVLTHQETNRAESIQANEFADDETGNLAAYEQAGFQKDGDSSGGIQRFFIGDDLVKSERAAHVQRMMTISRDVAKDLGFDPDKVLISKNEDVPASELHRELNGKKFMAAGLAYTHGPNKGTIRLFPEQFSRLFGSDDAIKGTTAHEVEHIKYQTALDKYQEEFKLVQADPGPPPDPNHQYWWGKKGGKDAVMAADGTLHPPYDKKYPNYQAMEKAQFRADFNRFRDSDGVSNYSQEWWEAFSKDAALYVWAMHETLAEMGKAKYLTGKFPEHVGNKGEKLSKADAAANAKIWRDLYRTVEKVYQGKA